MKKELEYKFKIQPIEIKDILPENLKDMFNEEFSNGNSKEDSVRIITNMVRENILKLDINSLFKLFFEKSVISPKIILNGNSNTKEEISFSKIPYEVKCELFYKILEVSFGVN